jgi:hypothetical protein
MFSHIFVVGFERLFGIFTFTYRVPCFSMAVFMNTKRKQCTAAVLRLAIAFPSSGDRRAPPGSISNAFGSLWATLGGALPYGPLKVFFLFCFLSPTWPQGFREASLWRPSSKNLINPIVLIRFQLLKGCSRAKMLLNCRYFAVFKAWRV